MVFPIPDGPSKHIISPSFFIEKETSFTFSEPETLKVAFLISKKLVSFFS